MMKNLTLVLFAVLSSTLASASECSISIGMGFIENSGSKTAIYNMAQRDLESKGYVIADAADATYALTIGSIQYCYGKKGPPIWAYERGYGVSLSKGQPDYRTRENILFDQTIDSMVLFGDDLATHKLKRTLRHLPTCAEITGKKGE